MSNGSLDYRFNPIGTKHLVQHHHFTSKVEQLTGGQNYLDPIENLDYMLRAFPNHPKALSSLMQWVLLLEEAQKLVGENANIHYNIGLIYLDLGEFNKSLDQAQRTCALGCPFQGLRTASSLRRSGGSLRRLKHWLHRSQKNQLFLHRNSG